jgi:hypothetical protein
MNVILIEKDGTIGEKHIKSIDKLYSICGYRSNKDFDKLYEWECNNNIYELYGKRSGKPDKENTYEFPEIKDEKYFGTLCIIKYNGSITLDEWNDFYTITDTEDIEVESESFNTNKIQFEEELTYEEYEKEK